MRLLVLGGTVFLSHEVAAEAVRRGHEVVCACRGESGAVPSGARLVRWDRAEEPPAELTAASHDAVVDVARLPSQVRRATAAFPDAHWVFVSTLNVYADETTPGGGPGTLALREPILEDVDLALDPTAYGAMKVAGEQVVRAAAGSSVCVRPGLIAGPGDPSGRFAYWPRRLAAPGEVLAPGDPGDLVQVIDVRDLAAWLVTLAERRVEGAFDAVGPAVPLHEVLGTIAPEAHLTWVDQEFLTAHAVEPWSGEDSVPLWLPRPDYDGMMSHDVGPALAAGLAWRGIEETARDTLAWLARHPGAAVTGIDRGRERALLDAWHAQHG